MAALSANRLQSNLPARFIYRTLIARRSGVGFGVQIGTRRFLGTFLTDPVNVPVGILQC